MNTKLQAFLLNFLSLMGFASFLLFLYHGYKVSVVLVGQIIKIIMESGALSSAYSFQPF
ncbi:MAG: hypothetical protein ACK4VN_15340 [Bacteroidales bacterium]